MTETLVLTLSPACAAKLAAGAEQALMTTGAWLSTLVEAEFAERQSDAECNTEAAKAPQEATT